MINNIYFKQHLTVKFFYNFYEHIHNLVPSLLPTIIKHMKHDKHLQQ